MLRVVRENEKRPYQSPTKVLFCGSRTFNDYTIIEAVVMGWKALANEVRRPLVVVEGEARGADTIAREMAERHDVEVIKCPADWDKHGRKAGFLRNHQMLEEHQPDFVVAFADDIHSSTGTWHMASIAQQAGVPVYVVSRFKKEAQD